MANVATQTIALCMHSVPPSTLAYQNRRVYPSQQPVRSRVAVARVVQMNMLTETNIQETARSTFAEHSMLPCVPHSPPHLLTHLVPAHPSAASPSTARRAPSCLLPRPK